MKTELIEVRTKTRMEMVEITAKVRNQVTASGVKDGFCLIYVPHTTAAVTINESHDPSVQRDIVTALADLIPHQGDYTHYEGNSDSHIKACLTGNTVTVLIENGDLLLGTWEGIFLCEFDGPRTRKVYCKIVAG